MKKTLTLSKSERLKSRKLIEQVFVSRQSFNSFPFRVFFMFTDAPATNLQAGFGVSTKNFKRAVDRNRVKRLTREAYRLNKNELQIILVERNVKLVIFFIYTAKELPDFRLVTEKIKICLQRLINLVNEKVPSNN